MMMIESISKSRQYCEDQESKGRLESALEEYEDVVAEVLDPELMDHAEMIAVKTKVTTIAKRSICNVVASEYCLQCDPTHPVISSRSRNSSRRSEKAKRESLCWRSSPYRSCVFMGLRPSIQETSI